VTERVMCEVWDCVCVCVARVGTVVREVFGTVGTDGALE